MDAKLSAREFVGPATFGTPHLLGPHEHKPGITRLRRGPELRGITPLTRCDQECERTAPALTDRAWWPDPSWWLQAPTEWSWGSRRSTALGSKVEVSMVLPDAQRLPLASALRRALDVARGWEG
ncbi:MULTISPECIES: hypothetical protein [Streptomyces]|uniref:Uncharacterized protein n=1 Tax=Streptomyces mirabilis TaxID=68239 RepID=A0ABU3V3R9_9ACTN|nr:MULTISPECIES: hypothetical protein [Streptomyces]MCX4617384.1 hypothetical protein [Streptomyces mirabilis]MCX5356383.1 hypothetical protein [Streptomyces mirabilis]MDU9000797.1 hypothetical protein [Streptomyces mirabilis]QDN84469.1 hypothetical protein FNV61_00690 [Streptomyces sp. RLB3-6]QDO05329.1 hypothetical protein FNV68_02170 [Streptomyces sp. S1D4-23]